MKLPRYALMLLLLVASLLYSCADDDLDPADRPLCAALGLNNTQAFLDMNNTGQFEELANTENTFLSVSPNVAEPFDGTNVIQLLSARVDFDFEDGRVDPGSFGGFYARWKLTLVPFDADLLATLQNANSLVDQQKAIDQLNDDANAVEVQLSGPFLENGCEWGDTDEIGTQQLMYSNYGIYDWDYFPAEDRVIGAIHEGDDGLNDDLIAVLDISRSDGQVIVEAANQYRIVFTSLADVLTN